MFPKPAIAPAVFLNIYLICLSATDKRAKRN